MTDSTPEIIWKLGAYVRVWKNEGYEYGHIETVDGVDNKLGLHSVVKFINPPPEIEVRLVGDDGREIFCRVKDLEEGE